MRRAGVVAAFALVCACGRVGFEAAPAGELTKPDGAPVPDADPTIDAPIGMGSYTIAESTAPYTLLDGADVVPGFEPGSDEGLYELALPFTFTYYGIPYDKVAAHMNGYVTFGGPVASPEAYQNDCPLDASAPDAMIAVFWDDLFASKMIMPFGTLRFAIKGAAPTRSLEIEWRDVDAFYRAGTGNNFFSQGVRTTQKIVLRESGVIALHYGPRTGSSTTKDCGVERHIGCSASVGLRAPSSAVLQPIQCGTETGFHAGAMPLADGRLITFTPQ
ncbi:MAG: hypothetical protein M4D80_31710 [Myxococcota bacterium]|nr:hypothetical protein [Myxococcota bacterium]